MLDGPACMKRIHGGKLIIERRERQQTTCHTHVVPIASKGWANNQHESCSKKGTSTKSKERFQTHTDKKYEILALEKKTNLKNTLSGDVWALEEMESD